MLQKTNPEIVLIENQISNMQFLINEIIPFARSNPEKIDFNKCEPGEPGCLIYWYTTRKGVMNMAFRDDEEFGLPPYQTDEFYLAWGSMFGSASAGDLDDRETAAKSHLETLQERRAALL